MSIAITFTVPGQAAAEQFKEQLRESAMRRGMSMSELVVEALTKYLKESHGQK